MKDDKSRKLNTRIWEHQRRFEMNRKKVVICFRVTCATASLKHQLWAIGLSFSPSASSIHTTDSVDLDVVVSGMDSNVQMYAFRNLAAYDFKIYYDPAALNFSSYMLRGHLLKDNRCLSLPGGGKIKLSEFSRVWDFNFRSTDALNLARISFFGSGLKSDSLSFSNTILHEDQGEYFSASWGYGGSGVSKTSGTGAMLLFGSGLTQRNFL